MPEYEGTSRRDGQNPDELFKKYRKENPKEKTAREEIKEDGTIETQTKSAEIIWQELTAHKQNEKETFSKEEHNEYYKKMKELRYAWQKANKKEKNK